MPIHPKRRRWTPGPRRTCRTASSPSSMARLTGEPSVPTACRRRCLPMSCRRVPSFRRLLLPASSLICPARSPRR
jgi:hypothetical protein